MRPLVLSLFPGIGLLDRAFEEEGFCVVRGPDLLWGGDHDAFTPPPNRFDGIIGGPPCQTHSQLAGFGATRNGVRGGHRHGDMIPGFVRTVREGQPKWFLMENVEDAPVPQVPGYDVCAVLLNNRWFGADQNRVRRFTFGSNCFGAYGFRQAIQVEPLMSGKIEPAVLAGHGPAYGTTVKGIAGRRWQEMAQLQGLPWRWIARMESESPLTVQGLKRVIGNGVPLPMGRAVAKAVKQAMHYQLEVA